MSEPNASVRFTHKRYIPEDLRQARYISIPLSREYIRYFCIYYNNRSTSWSVGTLTTQIFNIRTANIFLFIRKSIIFLKQQQKFILIIQVRTIELFIFLKTFFFRIVVTFSIQFSISTLYIVYYYFFSVIFIIFLFCFFFQFFDS